MRIVQQSGKGLYRGTGSELHILTTDGKPTAGRRCVIFLHGVGGDATQFSPGNGIWAEQVRELARAGFICLSIDASGLYHWSKPDSVTAVNDAFNYATVTLGCLSTVDVIGWSMGGLLALNWYRRNLAKVHRIILWNPVTDLDYAYGVGGGWTTQINSAYGGSDPSQYNGYDPIDDVANFVGLGIPVRIYHAEDDVVIPMPQSQAFAAAAGIEFEHIITGGDHVTVFDYVSTSDVIRYLAA